MGSIELIQNTISDQLRATLSEFYTEHNKTPTGTFTGSGGCSCLFYAIICSRFMCPNSSTLWLPAAATSNARLTFS